MVLKLVLALLEHRHAEFAHIIWRSGIALFLRIAAVAISYLNIVLLARWLGTKQFGAFSFALAWLTVLSTATGFGFGAAALRYVPQYRAAEAWGKLAGFLAVSRSLTLLFGCVSACAIVTAALFLRSIIDPTHFWAFIVAVAVAPLAALAAFNAEAARGLESILRAYGPIQVGQPLLFILICVLLLPVLHLHFDATTAILALAASYVFLLVQQGITDPRVPPARKEVEQRREWLTVSFSMLLVQFVSAMAPASVIMTGIILLPADTAVFSVITRVAAIVTLSVSATVTAGLPRFSLLYAQNEHNVLQAVVSTLEIWAFWPAAVAALGLVVGGPLVLDVFGLNYGTGYVALLILVAANLFDAATGPSGNILLVMHHHRIVATVVISALIANVVLAAACIVEFGVTGAAIAQGTTLVVMKLLLCSIASRKLGIRTTIVYAIAHWWRSRAGNSG